MRLLPRALTTLTVGAVLSAAPHAAASAQSTPTPTSSVPIYLQAANSAAYAIEMENVLVSSIQSPRDPASRQATGKRQVYAPRAVTNISEANALWTVIEAAKGATPVENATVDAMVMLKSAAGSTCKAIVPATFKRSAKRLEVSIGDLARFFDASGKPRAEQCRG